MSRKRKKKQKKISEIAKEAGPVKNPAYQPDWSRNCTICDATPIVPATGMCGPCTFGEAETVDGNW